MRYLDHAATTPPREEALRAMWPFLTEHFGNPSSVHERGRGAANALDWARGTVAEVLGVASQDIVFTSGGTEANTLAVSGLSLAHPRGRHIVSAQTEHSSVREALAQLERLHGFEVSWLDLEPDGSLAVGALERALRPDTTLVTLMSANNEIGTLHDLAPVVAAAHAVGALVHTDAVQSAEWFDLRGLGVDALTLSGHKFGAPQGIGVAAIRSTLPLEPVLPGGGQQDGRRSGTENVPGAVALATALSLAAAERVEAAAHVAQLRDALIAGVLEHWPAAKLTGSPSARAPHIASFVFPGVNGEAVLVGLEEHGVQCSSGSACAAGSTDPSHVLTTLGLPAEVAHTAVRFSFGHASTAEDVVAARAALDATLGQLGWTTGR